MANHKILRLTSFAHRIIVCTHAVLCRDVNVFVCAILQFKKPHTFDWNRKYAFKCCVCYTIHMCIHVWIWKTSLTIPYPKRMDRDYCRVCLPIFVFVFDFLNAHSFFAFIKSFYISYVDLFYVIRFNIVHGKQWNAKLNWMHGQCVHCTLYSVCIAHFEHNVHQYN